MLCNLSICICICICEWCDRPRVKTKTALGEGGRDSMATFEGQQVSSQIFCKEVSQKLWSKQIYKIGRFPKKYEEIIELKGVGEYTAAAIASFAFKLPYAVVDGNVYRLLSRFYAINIPINTSKAKQIFTKKAQKLLSNNKPDIFNQAIMEFGSQIWFLFCLSTQNM